MKKKKTIAERLKEIEEIEFDPSELKGVLPENRELTQNIGCVGKKSKKKID
ncbi:hypothetical protein ACFOSV_08220 [Algoriphagus namhaensis]|uniref:Uncharacterized protein n=1 Tax=Algoriphagus namhaensis TaxID=915353 RepID=A0ABV8AQD8_9BACT